VELTTDDLDDIEQALEVSASMGTAIPRAHKDDRPLI